MPVKSFQGERAKKVKVTPSKLTVSDIMTRQLVIFTPEQSIHEVMRAFIKHRISGGPVVDESGRLVGVISIFISAAILIIIELQVIKVVSLKLEVHLRFSGEKFKNLKASFMTHIVCLSEMISRPTSVCLLKF